MSLSDYQTALVTGASSGIGTAVVRRLADRGLEVHAAARRKERLDELAQATGCVTHVLDVRETGRLYEAFESLPIDVLVNNAGLGRGFQELFAAPPKDIDTTVDTNVRAAIHVLRAVLPGMVERKCGHVVNIGSVAGLYPVKSSIYGATKGAIHLLCENLRLELQGSGVRVTEICPARVRTEFFDAAIDDPTKRDAIKETGINELTPDDIADAIIYAIDAPWRVNVNLIEIHPTEQVIGGVHFAPVSQ